MNKNKEVEYAVNKVCDFIKNYLHSAESLEISVLSDKNGAYKAITSVIERARSMFVNEHDVQ